MLIQHVELSPRLLVLIDWLFNMVYESTSPFIRFNTYLKTCPNLIFYVPTIQLKCDTIWFTGLAHNCQKPGLVRQLSQLARYHVTKAITFSNAVRLQIFNSKSGNRCCDYLWSHPVVAKLSLSCVLFLLVLWIIHNVSPGEGVQTLCYSCTSPALHRLFVQCSSLPLKSKWFQDIKFHGAS